MAGASYGVLAKQHGISKSAIYKKAQKENWPKQRERLVNAVETKTIEKTSDTIATNAAKLEKAKGLAIDRLLNILERFPQSGGDKVQRYGTDEEGHSVKNQYSLLDIVTALEKLERNSTIDEADDPLNKLFERMDADVQR